MKVVDLEPKVHETIMSDAGIKDFEPKYAKLSAIPKYLGVSRSTALRIIQTAEETGYEHIRVSLSPTLQLVRLRVLDEYIASKDKNGCRR